MTEGPWLQDPDVTLYHGDVLAVLPKLPAESVDCVVTSPPYWGLRDYGTGGWQGGDDECDHARKNARNDSTRLDDGLAGGHGGGTTVNTKIQYTDTCGKCGATRIDQQLGLEPTPEQYVERMVEVFREVRRVLAAHGTVWLNLGDSFSHGGNGARDPEKWPKQSRNDHRVQHAKAAGGLRPKDMVGIPWRVAFALQADGWYLRSDIIWSKPNPMPESVTDRPTKAHEYVFLLSKQPRYFFDQEAVREALSDTQGAQAWRKVFDPAKQRKEAELKEAGIKGGNDGQRITNPAGRNIRSVWEIATQPYPEAHFATFPEELARRCIAAGCPEQVCRVCGKARERVVEKESFQSTSRTNPTPEYGRSQRPLRGPSDLVARPIDDVRVTTVGFTDCDCYEPSVHRYPEGDESLHLPKYRPGIVLDPFMGSGTVAHVARKLGRHAVGIDLSAEYLELAARRLQQQSLFAESL